MSYRIARTPPRGRRVPRAPHWLAAVLAACISSALVPETALAHAHLLRSNPAAGATLTTPLRTVQLWFSESVDPRLSSVRLLVGDSSIAGTLAAVPGTPTSLIATFPTPVAGGHAEVLWRAVAIDGHPSSGRFALTITAAASATVAPESAAAHTSAPATAPAPSRSAPTPATMSIESPWYVLARWIEFASLIALIGMVAFRTFVVPRAGAVMDGAPGVHAAHPARWGLIATALFLLATLARLPAQRAAIGDVSLATIVASAWGHVWLLQCVVAVVACIAFAAARGRTDAAAWWIAGAATLVLGITPALSGHAIASPVNRALAVTLDAVHVLAAGSWLGTVLALALIAGPAALAARMRPDADTHTDVSHLAALVSAFTPVALTSAAIVIVTGTGTAWLRLGSFGALLRTPYGEVLLVKLALVCLVLAAGAYNSLRARTALERAAGSPTRAGDAAARSFRRSAGLELGIGLLVLMVTAVLVAVPPPGT